MLDTGIARAANVALAAAVGDLPGDLSASRRYFARDLTEPFELDWNRLVIFKGITLHGIIGRRMYDTWFQMDQLLGSGRLDLRPAITHVMSMERFDEAIDLLRNGKAGKVVLAPWGQTV